MDSARQAKGEAASAETILFARKHGKAHLISALAFETVDKLHLVCCIAAK